MEVHRRVALIAMANVGTISGDIVLYFWFQ